MGGPWRIEERVGDAATLHAGWPAAAALPEARAVAICRVTGPAVVLGSTQPTTVVDGRRAAAAGLPVVRRRSGGGAVLVAPSDPSWVDLWLPAGDRLWRDDVHRAFDWLGEAWSAALGRSGLGALTTQPSPTAANRWSRLVCFAGVGSGEVVTEDGRKIVGLAQRRNRHGAWFHGACAIRWDPGPLLDVLAVTPREREAASAELRSVAAGVADLSDRAGLTAPDEMALAASLIASLP